MKPHLSQAKAFTVPIASVGLALLLVHGLALELVPGQAPEEAAWMLQDQASQQPSLLLPTVPQAMAADTDL